MRGEHEQTRELNRTAAELVQHSRELESEASHPDTLEGRVFSVSEVFDTKSVERRVSVFEVELAAIDFAQMFDDVGNGAVLHEHERRRSLEQFSIGKLIEVLHPPGLTCCFSSLAVARGQRFSVSMSFEAVRA
jgi:hypothetical protein